MLEVDGAGGEQVPTDLVEGVAQQADQVERIGANDGLGVPVGSHALQVGGAQVHGKSCELGRSLGTELVEECIEGDGVLALPLGPP